MEQAVQLKLMPSPVQGAELDATLHELNMHANHVSGVAFSTQTFRNYELRKKTYAGLRSAGIGSQAAQHVIKKVADAYAALHAKVQAGSGKRRCPSVPRPITFRPDAAQPYDQRNLSFALDGHTISLWTLSGRLKDVSFKCSGEVRRLLVECKRGESDLLRRNGIWYLIVTLDVPEGAQYEPDGFIGVDLGMVNIATGSDGYVASGRNLDRYRNRQRNLRRKLQKKRTQSAKRRLKARACKEARHVRNTNHIIAKTIVAKAERTSAGIALEELKGIRLRVRLRKPQRAAFNAWAFAQLGKFIVYKARRAGVPLVYVDPAYTSQMCCACGHTDKKNRVDQRTFICRGCGVVAHADRNASHNIAQRGETVWNAGRESRAPTAP